MWFYAAGVIGKAGPRGAGFNHPVQQRSPFKFIHGAIPG